MCGLVGVVSNSGSLAMLDKRKWLEKAIHVNTLRGADSTGIACISPFGKEIEVWKKAIAGPDFLQLKRTIDLLDDVDMYRIVMAHNRAATMGGVIHHNAHPFQRGPITLCHNGTLFTFNGLDNQIEIDSDAIAEALSRLEAKEVLEKLDGAFALTWHDARDNSFHIARNSDRPLFVGFTQTFKTMIYASEDWMIDGCKGGLTVKEALRVPVGKHMIFRGELDLLNEYEEEDFVPLDLGEPTGFWHGGRYYYDYYDRGAGGARRGKKPPQNTQLTTNTQSTPTTGTGSSGSGNVLSLAANAGVGSDAMLSAEERREKQLKERVEGFGYYYKEPVLFKIKNFQPFLGKPEIGMSSGWTYETKKVVDSVIAYNVPRAIVEPYLKDGKISELTYIGNIVSARMNGSIVELTVDNVQFYVNEPDDDDDDDWEHEEAFETDLVDTVEGPHGKYVEEAEFNDLTKYGCAHCGANLSWENWDEVVWMDDGQPLCMVCNDLFDVKTQEA